MELDFAGGYSQESPAWLLHPNEQSNLGLGSVSKMKLDVDFHQIKF
jgi:hypothetical protein